MNGDKLYNLSLTHMEKLCRDINERPVGSEDNKNAVEYFRQIVASLGWSIDETHFDALDWREKGADLQVGEESFEALVSPYAPVFLPPSTLSSKRAF